MANFQSATSSINLDDSKRLFVGDLMPATKIQHLFKYFIRFGDIENVYIARSFGDGICKGYGFVVFENLTSLDAVLSFEQHVILGSFVKTRKGHPRVEVLGLLDWLSSEEIKEYFSHFGRVVKVGAPRRSKNNSLEKTCAVTFHLDEVVKTLQTTHMIKGVPVYLRMFAPKDNSTQRDSGETVPMNAANNLQHELSNVNVSCNTAGSVLACDSNVDLYAYDRLVRNNLESFWNYDKLAYNHVENMVDYDRLHYSNMENLNACISLFSNDANNLPYNNIQNFNAYEQLAYKITDNAVAYGELPYSNVENFVTYAESSDVYNFLSQNDMNNFQAYDNLLYDNLGTYSNVENVYDRLPYNNVENMPVSVDFPCNSLTYSCDYNNYKNSLPYQGVDNFLNYEGMGYNIENSVPYNYTNVENIVTSDSLLDNNAHNAYERLQYNEVENLRFYDLPKNLQGYNNLPYNNLETFHTPDSFGSLHGSNGRNSSSYKELTHSNATNFYDADGWVKVENATSYKELLNDHLESLNVYDSLVFNNVENVSPYNNYSCKNKEKHSTYDKLSSKNVKKLTATPKDNYCNGKENLSFKYNGHIVGEDGTIAPPICN